MKKLFTLLLTAFITTIYAQNLERFIPENSQMVVEVSGDQLLSLIDIADVSKMLPPGANGEMMDLNEIGFAVNDKAYYFNQKVDDMTYHNLLMKINNLEKAEATIMEQMPLSPQSINGYQLIVEGRMTIGWNKDMILFTNATVPKEEYTMDDLLREKSEEEMEMQEEMDKEREGDIEEEYDEYEESEDEWENLEFELKMKNLMAPDKYSSEELAVIMEAHFMDIVSMAISNSITQVDSYNAGKDTRSSTYFWVNNLDGLMTSMLPRDMMSSIPGGVNPSMMLGYKSVAGNLIFGKDEIKVAMAMEIQDSLAPIYKRMFRNASTNSLFKYLHDDDAIAYINSEMNMTTFLEEYPNLIDRMYGNMFPEQREAIDVGTDLISIVLDEEAIGKLFTGNMLMVVHDIENKEVKYTTYEYDDEYNEIEVEKTRTETIPIFSVLLGSENRSFFQKLIKIATKYEMAEKTGSSYIINLQATGAPFDLHFSHQDGVVMFTNSAERLKKHQQPVKIIATGRQEQNQAGNIFAMFIDLKYGMDKLSDIMPIEGSPFETLYSFQEVRLSMGPPIENRMKMDLTLKTDGQEDNTLQTILSIFSK